MKSKRKRRWWRARERRRRAKTCSTINYRIIWLQSVRGIFELMSLFEKCKKKKYVTAEWIHFFHLFIPLLFRLSMRERERSQGLVARDIGLWEQTTDWTLLKDKNMRLVSYFFVIITPCAQCFAYVYVVSGPLVPIVHRLRPLAFL